MVFLACEITLVSTAAGSERRHRYGGVRASTQRVVNAELYVYLHCSGRTHTRTRTHDARTQL